MSFKTIWTLTKTAVSSWIDDYAPSMGAALAYYTLFSIAPLLLIVIAVAGAIFGAEAARGEIFEQLRGLMGAQGATAVEGLLESVRKPGQGLLATVIGLVTLFIGATSVFGELQSSLDRIWRVPAQDTPGGVWGLVRKRLLAFGMILGIGFLLMVSLVASAALAALGRWWAPMFGNWALLANAINVGLSFVLVMLVFAMIYKIMPSVRVQWRDVWVGAAVTALLFTLGKQLIGIYLGTSAVASGFGAAASLVVLLVWVYYSAQIFLMGAEFTWVYAHTYGSLKGRREAPRAAIPTRSGAAV